MANVKIASIQARQLNATAALLGLRTVIGPALWAFYDAFQDQEIVQVDARVFGFIPIRINIHVRDLRPLFETLAGPHP